MTKAIKKSFVSSDGLVLNALEWLAPNPKAHIILVHGLGEHIGRYDHLASFYNSKSISVTGFDLRGHGLSKGPRGYTPSYDQLIKDVESFINEYKDIEIPKILYGHSMGGNLVLNYLMECKNSSEFVACIATSPWIKLVKEPPALLKFAAKILNSFGGFTKSNELDATSISTIKEEVEKYKNDPLVHDKVSSVCALGVMNAGEALIKSQKQFPIPLLINHGTEDRITSHEASKRFSALQKNDKIELKLWEGMYHELHNDKSKEQLFNHCEHWICKFL